MCTNNFLDLYIHIRDILGNVYDEGEYAEIVNVIWGIKKGRIELNGIGVEWLWDDKKEFVTVKEYQV